MNNYDKIRSETASLKGMAKLFCSPSWEGNGRVFSAHAAKYMAAWKRRFRQKLIG